MRQTFILLWPIAPIGLYAANAYTQHNLVSDLQGIADHIDPNLKDPWGIAVDPATPFWISNNDTGTATLYDGNGNAFPAATPIVATIPAPCGGTPPAAPTGQVFNDTGAFLLSSGAPALFIFATEQVYGRCVSATVRIMPIRILCISLRESPRTTPSKTTVYSAACRRVFSRTNLRPRVTINNFAFAPTPISVSVGTQVMWTKAQGIEHDIRSDDSKFDPSPVVGESDKYSVSVTALGTYSYHCGIHPFMKGTIVVQ